MALLFGSSMLGGCHSHVSLSAPPPTAPLSERTEAYEKLRPVRATETVTTQANGAYSIETEMMLRDGTRVYFPDDILPVVPPRSEAAMHVYDSRTNDARARSTGLISFGSTVGAVVLFFPAFSNSNGDRSLYQAGFAITALAAAGFGVASYLFNKAAADDALLAYEHYDGALQERLSICVGARCGREIVHEAPK